MKAANLLISNDGCLKIADFGLARAFDPRITQVKEDVRGKERKYTNCVVTRWYRPPELLLGARQYGGEVDMWGIGYVHFTPEPSCTSLTLLADVYLARCSRTGPFFPERLTWINSRRYGSCAAHRTSEHGQAGTCCLAVRVCGRGTPTIGKSDLGLTNITSKPLTCISGVSY